MRSTMSIGEVRLRSSGSAPCAAGSDEPPRAPRALEAQRGWAWIVDAFALFKRDPLAWIIVAVIMILLFVVLGSLPLFGTFLLHLVFPALAGGM